MAFFKFFASDCVDIRVGYGGVEEQMKGWEIMERKHTHTETCEKEKGRSFGHLWPL